MQSRAGRTPTCKHLFARVRARSAPTIRARTDIVCWQTAIARRGQRGVIQREIVDATASPTDLSNRRFTSVTPFAAT